MPPNQRPSQASADPLARFGMTAEEIDEHFADEIALCRKYDGDSTREVAEHEATTDE